MPPSRDPHAYDYDFDALLQTVVEVERATEKSALCSALDALKSTASSVELTPSLGFVDVLSRIEHVVINHASIDVRARAIAAFRVLWKRALDAGAAVNAENANGHAIVRRALNAIANRLHIEREEDIVVNLSHALVDLTPHIESCEDVCAAMEAVATLARADDVRAMVDVECVRTLCNRAIALNDYTVTKSCETAYYMLQGYAMRHRRQAMRVAGVMACGALACVHAVRCPESAVHDDYADTMLRLSVDAKPDVREACCASIAEHMKSRMAIGLMTFRAADAKLLYAICVCQAADEKLKGYLDDINRAHARNSEEGNANVMTYVLDEILKCISDDSLRACEALAAREQCIRAMSVLIENVGATIRHDDTHHDAILNTIVNNVAMVWDGIFFDSGLQFSSELKLSMQVLHDLQQEVPDCDWLDLMTRDVANADIGTRRNLLLLLLRAITMRLDHLKGNITLDKLKPLVQHAFNVCQSALKQTSPTFNLAEIMDFVKTFVDTCFEQVSHEVRKWTKKMVKTMNENKMMFYAQLLSLRLLCLAQTEDVLNFTDIDDDAFFQKIVGHQDVLKCILDELPKLCEQIPVTDSNWYTVFDGNNPAHHFTLRTRMYAALFKRINNDVMNKEVVERFVRCIKVVDSPTNAIRAMTFMRAFEAFLMSPKREKWTGNRPVVEKLSPILNALVGRLRWSPGAAASTLRSVAARIFANVASVQESELLSLWLTSRGRVDNVADVALNILAEDDVCSHDVLYGALALVCGILGDRSALEQMEQKHKLALEEFKGGLQQQQTLEERKMLFQAVINRLCRPASEERRGDLQQPTLEKHKILVEAVIERLSRACDCYYNFRPYIADVVVRSMVTSMMKLSHKDMIELIRKAFPHIDDDDPEVRQEMAKMYSILDIVYPEEIQRLCAATPSFTYEEGKLLREGNKLYNKLFDKLLRAGKLFGSDTETQNR